MAETLIANIVAAVQSGADDSVLNGIIQQHITDFSLTSTIAEWRVANYADLRRWAYPNVYDYIDAAVKLESASSNLVLEGQEQKSQYVLRCLAVKLRFPKS